MRCEYFQVRRRSPLWWAHISSVAGEMASVREAVSEVLRHVVRDFADVGIHLLLRAQ
jgi:hypothetical protein